MIGRIRGQLVDKTTQDVLVEAGGVGYEISLTLPAWFALGETGSSVEIWTHFVVREDAQLLFGFQNPLERQMFRELIRVSGVGPKVALAVLSGLEPIRLLSAVRDQDAVALTRVPGIGKKTAERLVMELKDRMGRFEAAYQLSAPSAGSILAPLTPVLEDAALALQALGYGTAECRRLLKQVPEDCASVEDAVRIALRTAHRGHQ